MRQSVLTWASPSIRRTSAIRPPWQALSCYPPPPRRLMVLPPTWTPATRYRVCSHSNFQYKLKLFHFEAHPGPIPLFELSLMTARKVVGCRVILSETKKFNLNKIRMKFYFAPILWIFHVHTKATSRSSLAYSISKIKFHYKVDFN